MRQDFQKSMNSAPHCKTFAAFLVGFWVCVSPALAQPTYTPGSTGGGVHLSPASFMVVSGVGLDQPVSGQFHLRNRRGRVFSVDIARFGAVWSTVPTDGTLTVYGAWRDGILHATNISYDDGLYGSRAYARDPIPTRPFTLSGTLVEKADRGGFDLCDAKGTVYSVLTRAMPGPQSAQPLHQGDRVRLYGELSLRDKVPELNATNLVLVSRGK
jgi:hypothetical protein